MQLKNTQQRASIAQALAKASAVLLGAAAPAIPVHAEDSGWLIDSAVLYYTENNDRVSAIEPVINLKKELGDERILNLKLVFDSLTGASPNGAAPANVPQIFTFTSASGRDREHAAETGNVTPSGKLPLDYQFKDTRGAFSAGWQQPIGNNLRLNLGANTSIEYDFQSYGANLAIAKDVNDKNTTLSAGVNFEYDRVDPVGGAPNPLTGMVDKGLGGSNRGSDSKTVVDLLFGITQVLNRHAIVQANYSLSKVSGYQTDPYKMLTVVDASNRFVLDPSLLNPGGYNLYLFEARPDSRTRHSLYTELKYHLTEDVITASYRFTTDNWGIRSHTTDLKYRYQLGHNFYLEPHVRWYTQTAADFYLPYLKLGHDLTISGRTVTPLLAAASSDTRLGSFDATTFGVKAGIDLGEDSELSFRVERYKQSAHAPAAPATGPLAGQTLQPNLSALWFQVGYTFRW